MFIYGVILIIYPDYQDALNPTEAFGHELLVRYQNF